jgi:hypothetical protein
MASNGKLKVNTLRFDKNATGDSEIKLGDNLADALSIEQGSTSYLKFVTTNSAEKIVAGKQIDSGSTGIATDVIAESTAATGVTVDGLLIKDGAIRGLQTVSSTAAAITAATELTLADSGGVFNIDQDAAFDIDLPSPTTGAGCRYTFVISDAGANNVTITVKDAAATFIGTIVNDVTSVVPATGATLTFASGTAAVGDNIECISVTTGLYLVRAVSSAAGGITVA